MRILCALCFVSLSCIASDRLPIPRFVSLKAAPVNLRVGPGENFPIAYVYKKKNFPVQIIAEFQDWVKIKDFEDTIGWLRKNMIKGKRFCLVMRDSFLYDFPNENASKKAALRPRIIGEIKKCEEEFCKIIFTAPPITGWAAKKYLWGV